MGISLNDLLELNDTNTGDIKSWIDTCDKVLSAKDSSKPIEEDSEIHQLHNQLQNVRTTLATRVETYQDNRSTSSLLQVRIRPQRVRLQHNLNDEGRHEIKVVAATDETINDDKVEIPLSKTLTINYTHAVKPD